MPTQFKELNYFDDPVIDQMRRAFLAGGGGGQRVDSFNSRTGAVTLELGDVSAIADSRYVLKSGDTMSGSLGIGSSPPSGVQLFLNGTLNSADDRQFSASTVFPIDPEDPERAYTAWSLDVTASESEQSTSKLLEMSINGGSVFSVFKDGSIVSAGGFDGQGGINTTAGVFASDYSMPSNVIVFNAEGISFFVAQTGNPPVGQQISGANLTNAVTAGGTDDQISDYSSLTVYATDAAAIRNNIYQLARKLKQVNDALRAYGLLS